MVTIKNCKSDKKGAMNIAMNIVLIRYLCHEMVINVFALLNTLSDSKYQQLSIMLQ